MLPWYAVYKDKPQDAPHTEERAPINHMLLTGAAVVHPERGRIVEALQDRRARS